MNRNEIDTCIFTDKKRDIDNYNATDGFSCINYNTKITTVLPSYTEYVDYIKKTHRNKLLRNIRIM